MATGFPDYTAAVAPQRMGLGAGQSAFELFFSTAVGANSNVEADLYTVPAGYRLYLVTGFASSTVSAIQLVEMKDDAVTWFATTYDINILLTSSSIAGHVAEAGVVLSIKVTNNSPDAATHYGGVGGYLEKV
jgi:hypothetical protein